MTFVRRLSALTIIATISACSRPATRQPDDLKPLGSLPAPPPAGTQELWAKDPNQQTQTSRWFLQIAGEAVTVELTADLAGKSYRGTAVNADNAVDGLDSISWDATTGVLDFRRVGASYWEWVHGRVVEGVLTGRASFSDNDGIPPASLGAYAAHVVGWNERYFSGDLVPRTFDVSIGGRLARLRIDRDAAGNLLGRFKVYANADDGIGAEEIEYDVAVQTWDGQKLAFTRTSPDWTQQFSGTISGNALAGTMTQLQGGVVAAVVPFTATRTELLGFGLAARDAATRADWQTRMRRQLAHLMMADNPAPLSLSVARQPFQVPTTNDDIAGDRDDDALDHSVAYNVDELNFTSTMPNPYGGDPLARVAHGYLATPPGSAPAHGWPAVIVLNGHDGSALGTLQPNDSMYWYGDAWARRGWVVLALDIGHRPPEDRTTLYSDYGDGDRPDSGNGVHPAIKPTSLDSDWSEDGERVWDVERAIDYLASLGTIDSSRLMVTGLSMGAEVATFAAAFDQRLRVAVAAGFAPDLTVMAQHGNHPCWNWAFANPLDYFAVSDLHALIAPRPLVAEVGLIDDRFSDFWPPFLDAKEVTRRSRAAYGQDAGSFVVYLHDGGHDYRFGDINVVDGGDPQYLAVPALTEPRFTGDLDWSSDDTTVSLGVTLGDEVARMMPAPAAQ